MRSGIVLLVSLLATTHAIPTFERLPAFAHLVPIDGELTSDHITANTEYGPVEGLLIDGTRRFLGIPFAAPPVGDLRWTRPQPPAPWTEPKDATSMLHVIEHMCYQSDFGSEDCLYLNVYTPITNSTEPLPVMFWIYGGGFLNGDGVEFRLYDASKLAVSQNVVVVTHNYRVGPFGFLATDALRAESNGTANYGLLDQRFAMQWVQRNIASFGGDPTRVTIFGESAGAFSTCYHISSPASAGLFHAAIMESGTCESTIFFARAENSTRFSNEYMRVLGCDAGQLSPSDYLKCIRALSTKNVNTDKLDRSKYPPGFLPPLYPQLPWGPMIDGTEEGILDLPLKRIRSGDFNKVPVILGTNHDEGTLFVLAAPSVVPGAKYPLDEHSVELVLHHFFNDTMAQEVLDKYPSSNYKSQHDRAAMLLRDMFFTCSNRNTAKAISSHGIPTFLYQFTFDFGGPEYALLQDYHASELNFVFGTRFPPLAGRWDKNHKLLSSCFQTYWGNHAKFGAPNSPSPSPNVISWPAFTASSDQNIVLDVPLSVNTGLQHDLCDFWETYTWP